MSLTRQDVVWLLAYTRAHRSGTVIVEGMDEAWFSALFDLERDECRDAINTLGRNAEVRFIDAALIRRQVLADRKTKADRDPLLVPDADPDDPAAYAEALRAGRFRPPPEVPARPEKVHALLSGALHKRPEETTE